MRHWFWSAGIAVFVLLLGSLPYLAGYWSSSGDQVFMGIIYNAHDYGAYRSWVRQSAEQGLIRDNLTSEPNDAVIFQPWWWIQGQFMRLLHLSFAVIFQLSRWFVTIFALLVIYAFLGLVSAEARPRLLAFLIVCFGSGVGWIWIVIKQFNGQNYFPADSTLLPGNTFASLMTTPHFGFALALIVISFALILAACETKKWYFWVGAGLTGLLLGLVHYELVTVYAVLGAFLLWLVLARGWSWQLFIGGLIFFLISIWAVVYQISVYVAHPIWRVALQQYGNLGVWTPDPLHLVITLGPLVVVALVSVLRDPFWRRGDLRWTFVQIWFLVNLVLVYLPLPFQVMLLNGIQIPIAILSAKLILDILSQRFKQPNRRIAVAGFVVVSVAFLSLNNGYWLLWRIGDLRSGNEQYYLSKNQIAALDWLDHSASSDAVVLSAQVTGFYLPGEAGVSTYLAHGVYTLNYYEKRKQVNNFFDSRTTNRAREQLLESSGINYVFYGPAERALGNFEPATATFLQPAFSAGDVQIFHFQESP